jgi:hypothetical protein
VQAVTLLDTKKSMTVNIVLKNFNCPMQHILDAINALKFEFVTQARSQGLHSLLPEPEDAKALKAYTGDRALLAEAETFMLRLMEVCVYVGVGVGVGVVGVGVGVCVCVRECACFHRSELSIDASDAFVHL